VPAAACRAFVPSEGRRACAACDGLGVLWLLRESMPFIRARRLFRPLMGAVARSNGIDELDSRRSVVDVAG